MPNVLYTVSVTVLYVATRTLILIYVLKKLKEFNTCPLKSSFKIPN